MLDDTTKRELICTIQEEAERLNRFISNLLNMTRLQAGDLRLHTSPLDLSDAIGSTLRRAGKVLAAHRVEVRLQPDLTMLDLYAVLFEQVLFNLLDNAAKYAPPGSLVRITAWRDNDVVRLQVLDEGPGIPPADLDRVFEKFFRANGTVHRCPGTGLGLAICLGFIDAMRGTISAANRSDHQGAVFTVTLPVQRRSMSWVSRQQLSPKMGYMPTRSIELCKPVSWGASVKLLRFTILANSHIASSPTVAPIGRDD